MPVQIGDIDSTIQVDDTRGGAGAAAPSSASPSDPVEAAEQQRWLWLAQRQQRFERRTAAWGFDD